MSLRALGRHLAIASLAGVVSGFLVAGILGRLAMRVAGFLSRPELVGVSTSNGNRVGEITLGGTLAIAIFVGIGFGAVGAVTYAAAEPWLRGRRWRGLIFGGAILLALGFLVIEPANFDFERFGPAALNIAMFAALYIAFGAAIAWLFDALRALVARRGAAATAVEIAAWLVMLGVVALFVLALFSGGGADTILTTIVPIAIGVLVPPVVLWRGLPRAIGYAAFAVPVVFGAVRLFTGLPLLLD